MLWTALDVDALFVLPNLCMSVLLKFLLMLAMFCLPYICYVCLILLVFFVTFRCCKALPILSLALSSPIPAPLKQGLINV